MADHDEDVELYHALMSKATDKVIECCRKLKHGPLHVINIHKDTVLHVALYTTQVKLVDGLLELIRQLPGNLAQKMTQMRNDAGHTILHEAATYDKLIPAAEKMLNMAPSLLLVDSKHGEKATFRAARYGQIKMFKFLERKFENGQAKADAGDETAKASATDDSHIQRKDEKHFSTVLQVAVAAEEFELALYIAQRYPHLIDFKDKKGLTPLLVLAHKPRAFRSWGNEPRAFGSWGSEWLKPLINYFSTEDEADASKDAASPWIRVRWWEELKREIKKYKSAEKLAEVLVEKDSSWKWKVTESMESEVSTTQQGAVSTEESEPGPSSVRVSGTEEKKDKEIQENPLFVATKYGIIEIVTQVLKSYPQAVEYVDDDGRTILHIAVKYRQTEIIKMVEKSKVLFRRLIKKLDNKSNSVLHMVGEKRDETQEAIAAAVMLTPAHQLRDDLLLYERIEKAHATHIFKNDNSAGYSAEDLIAISSKELRDKAQDWLIRTAQNCSIVSGLIATVAFTAASTVPGGSDNFGIPVLLNRPFFAIFTIADVLSLTFTLTSMILFLSILSSSYRLRDFKESLLRQMMLGLTFLILSVSLMMLAFAAAIILMINTRQSWTKISLYTAAFLPVITLIIVYMPLYLSPTKTQEYTLKKIRSFSNQFLQFRRVRGLRKPKSTSSPSTEVSIEIEGQRAT